MELRLDDVVAELQSLANPADAIFARRFFRTGPGEYGAGDRFLGIRVPVLRRLAKKYTALGLDYVRELLHSPFHEARLLALLILIRIYDHGEASLRERVYQWTRLPG
jgi:hypothetical protein